MSFNSIDFALFFPIVFLLYWLVARNVNYRNIYLLIVSYIFYSWWDYRFLSLIIFSSLVDFLVGRALYRSTHKARRKSLLMISLFANLGLLCYFKYTNFFIDSFVDAFTILGAKIEVSTLHIILPVGISFYTFQTLSYTIDIYRKKIQPTKDMVAFFAFVSFFPQLVAGPIERASDLLPQFQKTYRFDYYRIREGFIIILFGLFKKIVIADRLGVLVNTVYGTPENYHGFELVIATVFFAFQILCDFSGYSDIAIGLARTLGFELSVNFMRPYFSKSIPEFWRRWHITLGRWFRDYLYFPLGGNRVSVLKTHRNIMIVFLVSGLWHGASWNFVIWGFLHGLYQSASITISRYSTSFIKFTSRTKAFSYKLYKVLLTFALVSFAWIFFRAETLADAWYIVKNLSFSNFSILFTDRIYELGLSKREFNIVVIALLVLLTVDSIDRDASWYKKLVENTTIFRWGIYLFFILYIVLYGLYGNAIEAEFIYFQF